MTERVFGDGVIVIYILGGPGAGKGTHCKLLADRFDFCHLSAGDLLRAEADREGSPHAQYIRNCFMQGLIVSPELIIQLLRTEMQDALRTRTGWGPGHGRFFLDGFPRDMAQVHAFEAQVCSPAMTLLFETTEEVMLKRVLERAKATQRVDDNVEVLKERFNSYHSQTLPVVSHFEGQELSWAQQLPQVSDLALLGNHLMLTGSVNKLANVKLTGQVAEINSSGSVDEVDRDATALIAAVLQILAP